MHEESLIPSVVVDCTKTLNRSPLPEQLNAQTPVYDQQKTTDRSAPGEIALSSIEFGYSILDVSDVTQT